MKIRLVILTENDKPYNSKLTENKIKKAWENVLASLASFSKDPSEKCTVESVEILDN